MATLTVYADSSDGQVSSGGTLTYSEARSGYAKSANDTETYFIVGQDYNGTYHCYESFTNFDTSSIEDSGTVTSATMSLYVKSTTDVDQSFTQNVYLRDWGDTLTADDWVAGATSLSPLLCHQTITSSSSGYVAFTDDALASNISKTGKTRMIHRSNRHEAGTTPTGYEEIKWDSTNAYGTDYDPKLVVEYTTGPALTLLNHLLLGD